TGATFRFTDTVYQRESATMTAARAMVSARAAASAAQGAFMRLMIWTLLFGAAVALDASAATVDGLKINSSSAGQARQTVILVHRWTCDSSSWAGQVGPLSKNYRVVTLDLPGHGQSGLPADGKFSVSLFARAVEAVRAETGADKVVLVGHSMGAPVIRQY